MSVTKWLSLVLDVLDSDEQMTVFNFREIDMECVVD
jgi:hypothetical protein